MTYVGTNSIKISTEMDEIMPNPPASWTYGYSFESFSFINKTACTVKINGSEPIFLDVEQGFEAHEDEPVSSFVIVEAGVEYQWIGRM
jgi:hypothetical protein